MPKNTSTIVVRPVTRGAAVSSKTVFGTLGELNRHAPLAEIAPHLICADPKPWKQASRSHPRMRRGRGGRRNAGRDDGQTWVSRRFVCGAAVDGDWDLEFEDPAPDVPRLGDWDSDSERMGVGEDAEVPLRLERAEVGILDIAKLAKLRGTAREYEMVRSVTRVMALPEDDHWVEVELDEGEWERIEPESKLQQSYAAVLRA